MVHFKANFSLQQFATVVALLEDIDLQWEMVDFV